MTKKEIKEALEGINPDERITFLKQWIINIIKNNDSTYDDFKMIDTINNIIKEIREERKNEN